MNTVEQELTDMLGRRAAAVEVSENLDGVIVGARSVADARRPSRAGGHRIAAFAAAAAVAVAVGAVVVALAGQSESNSTNLAADAPSSRIYPLLGNLGDLDGTVYGTFATPDPDDPQVTSVIVGRRTGDAIADVNVITAWHGPLESPIAETISSSTTRLAGQVVTVYEHEGSRWFRWSEGGTTVQIHDTVDTPALIEAFDAESTSPSVPPVVGLRDLAEGLEILSGPNASPTSPAPGVSTDSGGAVGVDLYVWPHLDLRADVTYRVVSVDDVDGYLAVTEDGSSLTWPIATDAWARLSTRGLSVDRTLEIANGATFVNESEWEITYNVNSSDYPLEPATTTTVG